MSKRAPKNHLTISHISEGFIKEAETEEDILAMIDEDMTRFGLYNNCFNQFSKIVTLDIPASERLAKIVDSLERLKYKLGKISN